VTAAERARLKKAGKQGGPQQPQQQQQQPQQQQQQQQQPQPKGQGAKGGKPPAGPPVVPDAPKGSRGKKAKAAKAKEKYAEQDEEDRQLALQVSWAAGVGLDGVLTREVQSHVALVLCVSCGESGCVPCPDAIRCHGRVGERGPAIGDISGCLQHVTVGEEECGCVSSCCLGLAFWPRKQLQKECECVRSC
jgi:hypothetical protein